MANDPDRQRPCLNLRSKEMYYENPSERPTGHDAEVARLYGSWDTRAYWCGCTQTPRGPDEQPVDRKECSRKDRACYRGLEHFDSEGTKPQNTGVI
jgi:hypothetical protein